MYGVDLVVADEGEEFGDVEVGGGGIEGYDMVGVEGVACVAFGAEGVCFDGWGVFAGGGEDAGGYFAAVGDEEAFDGAGWGAAL